VFAALVNLAVIVTVKRTPALHRPVNVLLCSLAAADCLSGLVAQPIYATWRLLLHHTTNPCVLMLLYQATQSLPFLLVGCTFLNLAITSVERLFAVSKPIVYSTTITRRGMLKTVFCAWVIWFIYIIVLETAVPEVVYKPMENITLSSLIAFPIGGHVLTFFAIHTSNRRIVSVAHNSQQAFLFKREKRAFTDMTMYTIATLCSILPILLLLNVKGSVFSRNILFPWAATFTFLLSSFNPVIQIWRNATLRQALRAAIVHRS
ncbi:unnamed protein product, partial [Porites evermanni]